MSWRIVYVTEKAHVCIKNDQFFIENEEKKISIPVNELAVVVIDCPYISITAYTLSFLSERKATVIFTNSSHLPVGSLLPYYSHHRALEKINVQINTSIPLKNKIWKHIVQQKIENQHYVLKSIKNSDLKKFKTLALAVKSGDKTNRESVAAKLYWGQLFDDFKRHNNDILNNAIDFGYTILRSAIARSLTSYGFICAIGIHHCNTLNNFNLADDIIEPYRPLIDQLVYKNFKSKVTQKELSKEDKVILINVLTHSVGLENEKTTILNMIDLTCQSLFKAMDQKNHSLLALPSLANS